MKFDNEYQYDIFNLTTAIMLGEECSQDPRTHIGAIISTPLSSKVQARVGGFNRPCRGCEQYDKLGIPKNLVMHHAEREAIFKLKSSFLQNQNNLILYTNGIPCHNCTLSIIENNISKVVVHAKYDELIPQYNREYFNDCEAMLKNSGIYVSKIQYPLRITILFDGVQTEV